MTNLIKQRVVGILLVLIAGVVFLPDLLDGKKQQTKEQFKKIPEAPASEASPIVTDFPTEEVLNTIKQAPQMLEVKADDANDDVDTVKVAKQSEPVTAKPVVVKTEPASKKPEPVKEQEKTVAAVKKSTKDLSISKPIKKVGPVLPKFDKHPWILQLGSFKHKGNVDALKKRLTDAGFKVFIKPVETKSGVLSKVFVGPELDRKKLEKAQRTLKELTGLNGKITKFDPIN